MAKVKSYKSIGEHQTYDLEVDHPDHQFYLANGLLTSNSHSVAYAIDSYYGAWLMTHYETDWLATCLQSESGNVEGLSVVVSEIKQAGYRVSPPDINTSGDVWSWSNELQAFVPPLSSLKRVGDTAVSEILENRPYRNLDELLFDADGKWRHTKVNRSCLESLLFMEAFGSLEEFQDGRLLNHRQLHEIIIGNYGTLKKGRWGMNPRKAAKANAPPALLELIESVRHVDDWDRTQKVQQQVETSGSAPHHIIFPDEIMARIRQAELPPIAELPAGGEDVCWFCVLQVEEKQTKNGKPFMRLKVTDTTSQTSWLRVWGNRGSKLVPYSIWLANVKSDPAWGTSTNVHQMKYIDV